MYEKRKATHADVREKNAATAGGDTKNWHASAGRANDQTIERSAERRKGRERHADR